MPKRNWSESELLLPLQFRLPYTPKQIYGSPEYDLRHNQKLLKRYTYSGGCGRIELYRLREVPREQRKEQAKTKCKEKGTAHPERKKTSKERKSLFRSNWYIVPKVNL
jgi:hypothetical protein